METDFSKIEIRRNTAYELTFSAEITEETRKAFEKLFGGTTTLTKEQQSVIEDGKRRIEEIKRKIWEYLKDHPKNDLDGNPILEETHEIMFDMEEEKTEGGVWMVAKRPYIQPKKNRSL